MAISEWTGPKGEKGYSVYVNLRSRPMPHLRFQKRVTGLKTMAEAQRTEKALVKELTMKVAQGEGHGFTWRMVVDKWATFVDSPYFMDRKYNPATVSDYVSMMHTWTKDWLDTPAADISRGDGREVLDRVLAQGRTKAFQKRLKNTINMIFNWGIESKIIRGVTHSPVFGLKIVLKEDKKPEILKLEEIRQLLKEARDKNHPWYPIWAVALLTGMRNGELFALKWSDVDLEKGLITVQRSYNKRTKEFKSTKAGYWRTVPVSQELKQLLLPLRQQQQHRNHHTHSCGGGESGDHGGGGFTGSRGGGRDSVGLDFVLPRIEMWVQGAQARVLREFCVLVGLSPIKFHTLRACFATQLISSGVEPIKVMKVCGWMDLKTMARYVRLAGIEEKGVTEHIKLLH
ncbi:tyrosine-type recombinase/integrase [Peredibacter starrii]|uniref:Tyrosine-type recombinase/integrase n=1 Tax=Peredibacter starrii TaxID=28202 RepID=A0AAX4HT67_9BACT|nr:tyrosine-type recombinase/integrase [Peredibacter starrii]WPU66494.1 tyrosine-type recombinase/integrase [Peredibacter starrii]